MKICSLLGEKFYSDKTFAKPEKNVLQKFFVLKSEVLIFLIKKRAKRAMRSKIAAKKFTAPASLPKWSAEPPKM